MKRVERDDLSSQEAEHKGEKSGKEKKRKQLKKERKEGKRVGKQSKSAAALPKEALSFEDWLASWAEKGALAADASPASGAREGMLAWRKMAVDAGWPDAMAAVHGVLWWNPRGCTQDELMDEAQVSRGSVHGALQALMERGLVVMLASEGKGKKRYQAVLDPARLVEVLWLQSWQRSLQRWTEVLGIWAQHYRARAGEMEAGEGGDVEGAGGEHWRGWAMRAERLSRELSAFEDAMKPSAE